MGNLMHEMNLVLWYFTIYLLCYF